MRNENVILRYFLKESFQIDEFKKYRKEIKNACDIGKSDSVLFHALYNTFLLRMWTDPGFLTDVLEKAADDPLAFKQLKDYLMQIYSNSREYKLLENHLRAEIDQLSSDVLSEYFNNHKVSIKEEGEFARIIFKGAAKVSNIGKEADRVHRLSLEYFSKRHEAAFNKGDMDEIIAISLLEKEYSTGYHHIYALYTKPSIYDSQNLVGEIYLREKDNYVLDSIKALISNIKFYHLYYGPEHGDKKKSYSYFFAFRNPEVSKKIIDLLGFITDSGGYKSELNLVANDKFIGDCLTILATYWFNDKSEKEKLALLNCQYSLSTCYPFNAEDLELNRLVKNWYMHVNNYANTLLCNYYIDEALPLYKHLIEQCSDKQTKYRYYELIAEKLLKSYRLDEAIKYYGDACKYSRDDLGDKFLEAKCLTKIAEIYYHLGIADKAQAHINGAFDIAYKLPLKGKLSVIWAISNCYRQIRDYKKEHECMNLMMDLDNVNVLAETPEFHERLLELNHPDFILSTYDFDVWKTKVAMGKYNFYNERGIYYYCTFQFKEAIKCLKTALAINKNLPLLNTLAICSIMDEDLEEAKEFCIIIQELDPRYPYSYVYLGLVSLFQNQIDDAIGHLSKAVLYAIDEPKAYSNIIGVFIFEYARVNGKEIDEIINKLINNLPEDKRDTVLKDIGNILLIHGFPEYSFALYNKMLSKNINKTLRADLLSSIARIYMLNGIEDKAIININEAIKNDKTNARLYYEKAVIYRNSFRFDCALKAIDKALKMDGSNSGYIQFQSDLIEVSNSVLKLELIRDDGVIQMLKTGEMLFLDLYKHAGEETLDFAPVLSEYGRALETMIHNNLSLKVREQILIKYEDNVKPYWYGKKKNKKFTPPLPNALKAILGKDVRSISLGSWKELRKDIIKNIDNPVVKDVDIILTPHIYGYSFIDEITADERYQILADVRNESSHTYVKTREDVLKIRSKIIGFINTVIEKIY